MEEARCIFHVLKRIFFDLNKKIGCSFISTLSQCKNKHLALDVEYALYR